MQADSVEQPLDYQSARRFDWRSDFFWPLIPSEIGGLFVDAIHAYLDLAANKKSDLDRQLLLATPHFLGNVFGAYEKALCIQHGESAGVRFYSESPEFSYLRDANKNVKKLAEMVRAPFRVTPPRHPIVRSLINTSRWTEAWNLPSTITSPSIHSVSVNDLLIDVAKQSSDCIVYRDAASILERARAQCHRPSNSDALSDLADEVSSLLTPATVTLEPCRQNLRELIKAYALLSFELVIQDLMALRSTRKLPREVWSATGGKYVPRLVGLEVIRRGGTVVRFDHGGSAAMTTLFEPIVITELCASTRFVMATPALAKLGNELANDQHGKSATHCSITGARGFPHHQALMAMPRQQTKKRKTVMYLSGAMFSGRKNPSHSISELVYVDWMIRFTEELNRLPVDLICKPHPDSISGDGHHPLESSAKMELRLFEDVIDTADVFVFDIVNSTTFWETVVCTSRPIIYVDIGNITVNPSINDMLRDRCRIIDVTYDDRNLPQIDSEEISDAVLSAPKEVDPSGFRDLFLGN